MSEKYDPTEHWNTREHPNTAENPGISPVEYDFLGPLLSQANSLLELGPGVGRLFPLYKSVAQFSTLDLSTNYTDRAQSAADAAGIGVQANFIKGPLDPFPFDDNTFDMGIASHVLMHIPFENIEHSMSELARCCNKVAVITVLERQWPRKGTSFDPRWHCFAHDYEALCRELGCEMSEKTMFREQENVSSFGFVFGKRH
jgi:ubiquinone/menaquinone biosynthesis C-methylase UbiE